MNSFLQCLQLDNIALTLGQGPASSMDNFLQFLRHTDAVPIVATSVVVATCVLTHFWYKMRVKQWEMSLKHALLERGMSAEEIKTVLQASALEAPARMHRCGSKREHAC